VKKKDILNKITDYYLKSSGFNGYPIREIQLEKKELIKELTELIKEKKISLNFGDIHPNPYIKAFPPHPVEEQIKKLEDCNITHICAYPELEHLKNCIDEKDYYDKPFTKKFALGEHQFQYYSFDLSVLEFYRNDPRYHYHMNDFSGSISITDEYYQSDKIKESDQILIEHLGFSYSEKAIRAVAVFVRDFMHLSPEHQQIWNAKLLEGKFKLHPLYVQQVRGDWPDEVSIFEAFIEEQYHLNKMCVLMGYPCLFIKEYRDSKPRNFTFLIRPTEKEYNDFVQTLDKMLSDNINKKFFQNDLSLENETTRKDGKIVVTQKGTIQLLEEWINKKYKPANDDKSLIQSMFEAFKKVRKQRNKPSHSILKDIFDQNYLIKQRKLMIETYQAVRTLRLIFSNHSLVRNYEIPDWLYQGKICDY